MSIQNHCFSVFYFSVFFIFSLAEIKDNWQHPYNLPIVKKNGLWKFSSREKNVKLTPTEPPPPASESPEPLLRTWAQEVPASKWAPG